MEESVDKAGLLIRAAENNIDPNEPMDELKVTAYKTQLRNYWNRLTEIARGKKSEGEHGPGSLAVVAMKSAEKLAQFNRDKARSKK